MNYKKWVVSFVFLFFNIIFIVSTTVFLVDPCFHYRKTLPNIFYELDEQRYQNDGILKHFDYNAIIIGTSMTENFKASAFEQVFEAKVIKVPFSGGTFKEINDNLVTAFNCKDDIKFVVRSLDITHINERSSKLREDLGAYPVYLYNDNVIDDIYYILNKDALKMALKNIMITIKDDKSGMTNFDEYCNWNKKYKFGKHYVVKKQYGKNLNQKDLSDNDKQTIYQNINENVIALAKANPNTTFYYFYPPYSIAYWAEENESGNLLRTFDGIVYATDIILEYPNIKLYYFGNMHDITENFDNYKDTTHYGEHINSKMLEFMYGDVGLLTNDNYKEILSKEREYLLSYPYDEI